jgi:hypothetical protein
MRGRKNWLKSLGYGARGQQIPDRWDTIEDGLFRRAVIFPQRPSVQPGDGIVLYAAGTGVFFAAGEATSWPYKHDDTPWPWRVDIELIASRDHVRNGVSLDALEVEERRHNIRIRRRSHVNLSQVEFDAAVEALRNA